MARTKLLRLAQSFPTTKRAPSSSLPLLTSSLPRHGPQNHQQHRNYSTPTAASEAALTTLPNINPTLCTTTPTTTPKSILPPTDLIFGRTFTDHMLTIEWTASDGWHAPQIVPYQNLSLDPATCVFHYAFCAFEGMKAYRLTNGEIGLFRPDRNMRRLNKSAKRIALPEFDGKALVDLIRQFVAGDERFIPKERGYSLYLRPTIIGTQRTLGVGPPGSALLYVIASPVGPYYPTGFKAVSLAATTDAVRAWPGGFGSCKLGANYAPGIVPQLEAAKRGLQQNLWLFGEEGYVTEVGTMNFFLAWKNKQTGRKELVTPPLDGTILEGVTRESVLQLAKERLGGEGWDVREGKFTIGEMEEAGREGRLIEAFGTGTAAVIAPVRDIHWGEKVIKCGLKEGQEAGELAMKLKGWIEGIQYGDEEGHPWNVIV